MKSMLVAVVALLASGCASSHHMTFTPKALQKPALATHPDPLPVCPRHPRTQTDLGECAGQRLLIADAEFNHVVTALWRNLDATGRKVFVSGQALWVNFENVECRLWVRKLHGGSIAGLVQLNCEVALTRARVKDVRGMLAFYRHH